MLDGETFDREQLDSILQQSLGQWLADLLGHVPSQLPAFAVQTHPVVDSTNLEVWQRLQQGEAEGAVAIAQQQQAGRGQRGHAWHSPVGGLYLSVGLRPQQEALRASGLTLGIAWGIATALRQSGIPVGIKWLNDLMLEGRKLGGILTETRLQQGQIQQAVIGIGINWRNAAPDPGFALHPYLARQPDLAPTLTSLEALAARVLIGVWGGYYRWKTDGTAPLVPAYEAMLINQGQPIKIDGQVGTIVGVTPLGHLRVQFADASAGTQERQFASGEVQLGYGDRPNPIAR